MTFYQRERENIVEVLAKAFTDNGTDELRKVLAKHSTYESEYNTNLSIIAGQEEIIKHISDIGSRLDETNKYTYRIVDLKTYFQNETEIESFIHFTDIYPKGIKLYQHSDEEPVAIAVFSIDKDQKIKNIILSRNKAFKEHFYHEEYGEDSPDDLPITVRDCDEDNTENDNHYIWRNANEFFKKWLSNNGYYLIESEIFDDCIGYRCIKEGEIFTIYMFAYGRNKTTLLDEKYCEKFLKYKLSTDSKTLISYLRVNRYKEKEKNVTEVKSYSGDENIELWEMTYVGNRPVLLFFPKKTVSSCMQKLLYAYNKNDQSILKYIFTEDNPYFNDYSVDGTSYNGGCLNYLNRIREEYGDMKIGYLRINDVIFSKAPYIDDYGFFTINGSVSDNKIKGLVSYPFENGKIKVAEFIKTDEKEDGHIFDYVPSLIKVKTIKDDEKNRFSLILYFNNGEQKKYSLPVNEEYMNNEVVSYKQYAFTDKIWSSARIINNKNSQNNASVEFVNGFSISAFELYHDSKLFCEEGDKTKIGVLDVIHIRDCNDDIGCGSINNDGNLYFIDTIKNEALRLPKEYNNTPLIIFPQCGGYEDDLIMVSKLGELSLQFHHNRSGCAGLWGWLDTDGKEVIAPLYIYALQFHKGKAIVCKGDWDINDENQYWCEDEKWGMIDKTGNEVVPCIFDELYEIDNTNNYVLCHSNGWEEGYQLIYDVNNKTELTKLDFDYDTGYVFNCCFFENDMIVFDIHISGEEKDYVYIYSVTDKEWTVKHQLLKGRTFNGETKVVVNKDGKNIIVF